MNKYDNYYEFRFASREDIPAIMQFIHDNWSKTHILANHRDFFEYEFCVGDRVGYFLAVDKETGEIAAGWAIYYYNREFVAGKSDVSSGMLFAKSDSKVPFLGVELMRRKFENLPARSHVSPGVNMNTAGPLVRRQIKNDISRMRHFYRLSYKEEYKIAKIIHRQIPKIDKNLPQTDLIQIYSAAELFEIFREELFQNRKPYKDKWYIEKRYFKHPVYQYKLYVSGEEQIVIVGREIFVNGAKILRIVDILGEVSKFRMLGDALQKLLDDNGYEYMDLYELAMNPEDILAAGFVERREDDENILPNYFEPYVCKNIEIYAHRSDTDVLCFKADGDQDRPNHMPPQA